MNSNVKIAIQNLIDKSSNKFGLVIESDQWDNLNHRMNQKIPDWFKWLFITYPLAHSILVINDKEDEEMEYTLEFVSPDCIINESIECYPGCAILDYGYICIATDLTGGGNPYFINLEEGDNPAVYQIYHDVSDNGEEILAEGKQKIADSLSELFERGQFMD